MTGNECTLYVRIHDFLNSAFANKNKDCKKKLFCHRGIRANQVKQSMKQQPIKQSDSMKIMLQSLAALCQGLALTHSCMRFRTCPRSDPMSLQWAFIGDQQSA